MRPKNILIGLAAVFAAGSVAGALFAPDKGARTRRKIGRNYRRLFHNADDMVEENTDVLEELKDEVAEQLEIIDEKLRQLSYR